MNNTELTIDNRRLTLLRYPENAQQQLQAWDAGDEYLIDYVEQLNLEDGRHILILNDHFGALAAWFSQQHSVTSVSDSYIATQGAKQNLQRNKCQKVEFLTSTDPIPSQFDIVLIQIPKNNRYLSWQLSQLRQVVTPETRIIAVNKAKDIHTSTLKLFERYLGMTSTSLARKKHRLVFVTPNPQLSETPAGDIVWQTETDQLTLHNLANVFSAESLDIGARFMMEHIPRQPDLKHIIDLGCGNGVLSVKAALLNPQAKITSVDESYMAVASCMLNLQHNIPVDEQSEGRFSCQANNCLDGFPASCCDLVLCNPPFHQQSAITDHIAWQMFCDAKHVLATGGRILVIGNRHLRYDVKLVRLFGKQQVKTVAANNKFVILQAIKR